MNIEDFRNYCLAKKGVIETFPFGETTIVMKVLDKMFALANLDGPLSLNLKCDPEKAIELREHYAAIKPGYHMNKQHWNTIDIDGTVDLGTIHSLIDHSYDLVVSKMSKVKQDQLK